MKVVYLGHPYGGDEQNAEDAKQIVRQLVQKFPWTVFLSPLQATGFYYNDIPYLDGMNHCIELLSRCDALWLCDGWQDSKGCCMEYAAAKAWDKPIYAMNSEWHRMPLFIPHEHERREKTMSRAEILQKAIDTYGSSMQEDICIEEMSELMKALIKERRSHGKSEADAENVREEIADVQIMLDQMRLLYGDTTRQENFKVERLRKRLERTKQ